MPWLTNKKTGKPFNTDWLDEDNKSKERQISKNKEEADEKNGKSAHKQNKNAQELAKLYNIKLQENAIMDEEVLISQLNTLKSISDDFPQVQKLMQENFGHELELYVESKGPEINEMAPAYTHKTGWTIHLNNSKPPYGGNLENAVMWSNKFGKKGKWGSTISTQDIGHNVAHEYGHILQYAFGKQLGINQIDTEDEILQIAMSKAGLFNIPKNISSYANKSNTELISECVADAYFNGKEAHPLSQEIYNLFKRRLG